MGAGPGSQFDPKEVAGFFPRRRWSLILGFVPVMIGVVLVNASLPETYQSSATFLIEQPRGPTAQASALAVLERVGSLATRETEITLVGSRRVIEPVVDQLDLHVSVKTSAGPKRPAAEVFPRFDARSDAVPGVYELRAEGSAWSVRDLVSDSVVPFVHTDDNLLAFANLRAGLPVGEVRDSLYEIEVLPFDQAIDETLARIAVAPVDRDADLVNLTCKARTAVAAQQLCEAMSRSYLNLREELQQAQATAAADFLAGQAKRIEERLDMAEDSLRLFTQRTRAVALETRASEGVRKNLELWTEREQLKAERSALTSLISQMATAAEDGSQSYRNLASFPTFVQNQRHFVTDLVSTLVELDTRRSELAVTRSEEDVELQALDARIADVERQIRDIANGYQLALEAQIHSLDAALENSGDLLATIPLQQIETARLERQVRLLEDIYGVVSTRLQEARIAQAVDLPSVRNVDRASLPYAPSAPNKTLNLALGFLLATSCGLMLALTREYLDTRVRGRGTLELHTGVPILTMLPAVRRPGPVIEVVHYGANSGHVAIAPPWNAERELALEAFRTLSADLAFVARSLEEPGLKSIAVTSSSSSEGKTYTACNLAIARASHGYSTLLVDADLRGQGVSRFFGLPSDSVGVVELVMNDLVLQSVIQTVEVGTQNQLDILPAGTRTTRSAEILESPRFASLLERLVQRYDLVVVDTPPLNIVTDTAVVSHLVDGVLVVVRGGQTDRIALELTLTRLERAGARTLGFVLNDVSLPSSYRTYTHAT